MVIYVCPKCGEDLDLIALMSLPPKTKYSCRECGFSSVEAKQVVRVPLKET